MDLSQGFLVEDDLDGIGNVKADDLGHDAARVGEEGVAEGGVGGDALSERCLNLGAGRYGDEGPPSFAARRAGALSMDP